MSAWVWGPWYKIMLLRVGSRVAEETVNEELLLPAEMRQRSLNKADLEHVALEMQTGHCPVSTQPSAWSPPEGLSDSRDLQMWTWRSLAQQFTRAL